MGVVNLTPDSFSDGGLYNEPSAALARVELFLKQGVDVIDLGPQSTRPGADEVGPLEEIRRLIPSLKAIRNSYPNILISVDTFHSSVAKQALDNGADWINDVTGGRRDPKILNVVAVANCPYVINHSRGNSKTMDDYALYDNLIDEILYELNLNTEIAVKAGVSKHNIIWDPGLGFSKTSGQNLYILNQLERIIDNDFPVLIGPSRKRFIGEVLGHREPVDRLYGTLAIACWADLLGISIIRVHDVDEVNQTLKMFRSIRYNKKPRNRLSKY